MDAMLILVVLFFLVAASIFILYQGEEQADLRVGMLKTVDTIHPLIAKDRGYFEDEGLSVSIHSFGTSPALAEAVAAGEIDAAYMSVVPAGIWKVRGTDIMIIAGASKGGDVLCTRGGETAGGKIALSNKGTFTQTLYSYFVEKRYDFEPVYGIEPSDMPTALLVTKDVDAVFVWEPFASYIEDNGGECIFDTGAQWEKEKGSKYQRNVLVVSEKVANDPLLVQKLLRINTRTVGFLNQNGSDAEIARIMNIKPLREKRVEYSTELDWESSVELWGEARENGYIERIPTRNEIVYGG